MHKQTPTDFERLCQGILTGLGIPKAKPYIAPGVDHSYRVEITRESSDKMFRTVESWLCVFQPPKKPINTVQVQAISKAAISANIRRLLLVVFGPMSPGAQDSLREVLAAQDIELVCLADSLAQSLARDFGSLPKSESVCADNGFSFARLREHARTTFKHSPWHSHFQTASVQPARILPLQREQDAALSEADLTRALQGGSLLLLGEPGAGKTTSLLALARDLATSGPLTPVFVPLGRYSGDFWETLGEALSPGGECLAKPVVRQLVESGVLVLLLDGINEIQEPGLHSKLASELNELTAPDEPTLHSRWVVSGRIHDYQQTHDQLVHLERRRWEMQPFTADLTYQLLADALGRAEGLAVYQEMGESARELCSNPLLLNMLLAVHKQHGKTPVGRGALYRQFVGLLLDWGTDRQLFEQKRTEFQRLWPEQLTDELVHRIAHRALTALASGAATTQIPWREARDLFAGALSQAIDPTPAAAVLLDELIRRGILRLDGANRVSFFHHTFQEYFHALKLIGHPADELIPDRGVPAQNREAVIFVAGLMGDPTPLVRRALAVDLLLTFEIVRDAPAVVPKDLIHKLARELWMRVQDGGGFYGSVRKWALLFKRLPDLVGKKLEDLALEVAGTTDKSEFARDLSRFYGHLGDAKGQQDALATVLRGGEVPEALLWSAAAAAHFSRDFEQAVVFWTRYIKMHPDYGGGYHGRATAYTNLGKNDLALADYEKAMQLGGNGLMRSGYGQLLSVLNRKQEAIEQLQLAIQEEPTVGLSYRRLADMLESEEPEEALRYREQAVRFAAHEEDLRLHLSGLARLQEKLGRHADAIRSLREMIALDPTSTSVRSWKERIAKHRQTLDAEERKRTVRERLLEHGELPLPTLVVEWLKAAGGQVEQATSAWVLAKDFSGMAGSLPVSLLPEPRITGAGLRAALESARAVARQAKRILVVAAADALELEARHQWAAMQDELSLGLVSSLEIRDALLQSDLECRRLLDRVMARSGTQDDPFEYKGIVREPTEFFGRQAEVEEFIGRISRGQQVGLYGIHKIGKSSLIEQLRRSLHVSRPEFTTIQIELDGQGSGPGDFYRRVLEKLPGLRDLPGQTISSAAFRRVLADYHGSRVKERPSHRMLLVVDEYPFLLPDSRGSGGLPGFIEVLGVLKTMHQEGWFMLLPCGRSAALNRQGAWTQGENPFIDLLHPHFLGPLTRDEMEALVTTLGRRGQLTFKPDALAEIFSETAGHPSLTRALGSQILREGKGQVTVARVQSAVGTFLEDRDRTAILRAIYETRMDADEQEIARTVALSGPQPRSGLFPAKADADRRRQIRDALQNLLDTTVLIEQPDERIAHRYGLLRRVVQREAKELGFA